MNVLNRRWLAVLAAFVGGLVIGLSPFWWPIFFRPSGLIASGSEWYSYVAGQRLVAALSDSELTASPEWLPNGALPLRPEDAIAEARRSLPALGATVADWPFSEITLRTESPQRQQRFYYTVTFRPKDSPRNMEWVQVLVYFNRSVTLPTASDRAP